MKIVQINTTCGVGSTGRICVNISKLLTENNVPNYILFSCDTLGDLSGIQCSNHQYRKVQALKSRVFGNYGFNSHRTTKKIICMLERIQPDVVHLHNIHGHDCNLEMLLTYFRDRKTKLVWTFHDCWMFTGYCTHFTSTNCDKWKRRCNHCPKRWEFSWLVDRSGELFDAKKRLTEGLSLTIVTPSVWLAEQVGQSFLNKYSVCVIHNGIDLKTFRPTVGDFRQKYGLEKKKIVLGVSFDWGWKKGLDVFCDLAERLSEDYQIVLAGTDKETEQLVPEEIITLSRIQDQRLLAEIYTVADVFVNPTREDSFPTVNLEALACGTPVVTFRTGGSPETINKTCGVVVECDDLNALETEIRYVCTQKPFLTEQCIDSAQKFEKDKQFKEYLDLYERVIASGTEEN